MHGNTVDFAGGGEKAKTWSEPRRTLLFVDPDGHVSDAAIDAVAREFPEVAVEQASEVSCALDDFDHPLRLVLVSERLFPDLLAQAPRLKYRHRGASTALIIDDSRRSIGGMAAIFESNAVSGVLPLNLRLDLWLSVIELMMLGGEYFPASLFQRGSISGAPDQAVADIKESDGVSVALECLTQRENEILLKVARGQQNKVIAHELGISPYTVKLHVHNIIAKLGVHNRTQAAAVMRDRLGGLQ
jgi:DNA-binding CsgD family transcriptional regulator